MRRPKSSPVPSGPVPPPDGAPSPVHDVVPLSHEVVLASRWSVPEVRAWLAPLHRGDEVTP